MHKLFRMSKFWIIQAGSSSFHSERSSSSKPMHNSSSIFSRWAVSVV
jgi:hypothetical protein